MVKVKLRDDVRAYENGISALEIAKSLGAGLFKAVCVCKINGEVQDLRTPVNEDCEIEFTGLSELMDNLMEYAERLLTTLHLAAFENHHLTLVFREEPVQRPVYDD